MFDFKSLVKSTSRKLGYEVRKVRYGFDPWGDVSRLSLALSKPIECVFDIGANLGSTSQEILRRFDSCRVFGFEPHPATFEKLKANITNDRFFPIQLAFSDISGTRTLYEYESATINSLVPNARFAERFDCSARELLVVTNTIDEFCLASQIRHIDLLKIDTEGHDYNVLRGAEKMLRAKAVHFIYFEFNDFVSKTGATGGSLNEISTYLAEFGFRFVATYTDYLVPEGDMFVVANALVVGAETTFS